MTQIQTERLLLRPWRDEDLEPFAAMNADPNVMEHFPDTLTREQSDRLATYIREASRQQEFGLWAVEIPDVAPFIGFVGLAIPTFESHFTPCVEIGWRLAKAHWGNGYATEAAKAALAHGFEISWMEEIVSFTATTNERSKRVMQRIGMTHNPAEDFDHPRLPNGHRLQRHVLYRIRRPT